MAVIEFETKLGHKYAIGQNGPMLNDGFVIYDKALGKMSDPNKRVFGRDDVIDPKGDGTSIDIDDSVAGGRPKVVNRPAGVQLGTGIEKIDYTPAPAASIDPDLAQRAQYGYGVSSLNVGAAAKLQARLAAQEERDALSKHGVQHTTRTANLDSPTSGSVPHNSRKSSPTPHQ